MALTYKPWHVFLACHHQYTPVVGDGDPGQLVGEERYCATCDRTWRVERVWRQSR